MFYLPWKELTTLPEKPISTSNSETKKTPLFPFINGDIKPNSNIAIKNGNEPEVMISDIQEVGTYNNFQQILECVEDTATLSDEKTEQHLKEKLSIASVPDDKHCDKSLAAQEYVYLCPFQGCSVILSAEVTTNIHFSYS